MKKNLTELVFILDKSGSMCGPGHVLFAITTDGLENASSDYSSEN